MGPLYLTYGTYDAYSNHGYRDGGGNVNWIIREWKTVVDAGQQSQQDICLALGSDWYWNGTECTNVASPIVIATRHWARYEFTSVRNGVLFDIDGDGAPEQVAWTRPDSGVAFLAIDRDGDGQITSGQELFGNHTLDGARNGFDALRRMNESTNGGVKRGSVSSDDPLFAQLLLWTDRNHNGISEPSELRPASEIMSDIGLGYQDSDREDRHGNLFKFQGWASLRTYTGRNRLSPRGDEDDTRIVRIWDVYFKLGQ